MFIYFLIQNNILLISLFYSHLIFQFIILKFISIQLIIFFYPFLLINIFIVYITIFILFLILLNNNKIYYIKILCLYNHIIFHF